MPPLQQISLMDPLQKVLNSFKIFERKLDKLQEELNFHGHALAEVRYMIAGISTANMLHEGDTTTHIKKTTGIQCDTITTAIAKVPAGMQMRPKRKIMAESIISTRCIKARSQRSEHATEQSVNSVMAKRSSSPTKRVISNRTLRRLKRQASSPRKSPSVNTKVAYKPAKIDLKYVDH